MTPGFIVAAVTANASITGVVTHDGAFETAEPFTATLDLAGASAGAAVVLSCKGTDLETDQGDFGATTVVIEA